MEYLRTTVVDLIFSGYKPLHSFAAEFVQTNRWHKQQSVTRSTDEVPTAWDAISLCRQNISAASQGAQIIDRLIDAQ